MVPECFTNCEDETEKVHDHFLSPFYRDSQDLTVLSNKFS